MFAMRAEEIARIFILYLLGCQGHWVYQLAQQSANKKGTGEIAGYHCWAEFYIEDKGWIPVDVSEAHKHPEKHELFFGGLDANRVQFTVGRDIELQPAVTSVRMNYFIYPYVLLDDQPVDKISTKFYFSDN